MIPTRYLQTIPEGTVVGFNSRSGALIIVYPNTARPPSFYLQSLPQVIRDTQHLNYKWLTNDDVNSIPDAVFHRCYCTTKTVLRTDVKLGESVLTSTLHFSPELNHLTVFKFVVKLCLTTRTVGVIRGTRSFVIEPTVAIVALHINGENCDSY